VLRVHCLECGGVYAKPATGGTLARNPGCPRCGYSGWIAATVDVTPATDAQPTRSVADPRQLRAARRR
jgi:predicted  nucleic acid-binding Zn-ribbon protein